MVNSDQEILEIKELAQTDMESAFQRTQALFFRLVQENVIYIIPANYLPPEIFSKQAFKPFTAPIAENDDCAFIRIFNDKALATKFAIEHNLDKFYVMEISGIELIQLAKYWFMRGTYGLLLNEGAEWITLPITDFLKVIYRDLIDQPQKYNQEFVDLVSLVFMIRSVYRKVFVVSQLNDEAAYSSIQMDGREVFLVVDEQESLVYAAAYKLTEVTEDLLKDLIFKSGSLQVDFVDRKFESTLQNLQRAYAAVYFPEEVAAS